MIKLKIHSLKDAIVWGIEKRYKISVRDVLEEIKIVHNLHALIIGANDGFSFDEDLQQFITLAKHALFIEPVPIYFEQLKQNVAKNPNFQCLQSAISFDGRKKLDIHYVHDTTHYSPESAGYASNNKAHLINLGVQDEHIRTETVPCMSMASVLSMHQFNYVQIDTEGMDYKIIHSIDLGMNSPAVFKFEILHMSFWEFLKIKQRFESNGYKVLNLGNKDGVAFRKP